MPSVVRFSPTEPGRIGWPSAATRRIASIPNSDTARCGPAVDGGRLVTVAREAESRDPRFGHGLARHPRAGDVDLEDAPRFAHPSRVRSGSRLAPCDVRRRLAAC